jgi:hypothetical protein
VYLIMDEFILAGEVQETSKKVCCRLPCFDVHTYRPTGAPDCVTRTAGMRVPLAGDAGSSAGDGEAAGGQMSRPPRTSHCSHHP